MKRNFTKRILAILLAMILAFGLFACGGGSDYGDYDNDNGLVTRPSIDLTPPTLGDDDPTDAPTQAPTQTPEAEGGLVQATELSDDDLRYVMIYNPKIYNENTYVDNSALKVGALGSQVDVFVNRGEGLETEPEFSSISQLDWKQYLPEDINLEDIKADAFGTDYSKGDKQSFYYSANGNLNNRKMAEFTCKYAGNSCYIWVMDNAISQTTIDDLGREFDQKIYANVSKTFGTPRFVGDAGKVNLLVYDLSGGLLGYFAPADLFISSELPYVGLQNTTCNTGHALLNINATILQNPNYRDLAYSTAAHELQHLINFSAFFNTANGATMNVWLNEAMSGYIETELYANAKELSGHYDAYNQSSLIRNGQSLYNFNITNTDIGVYGSVYYFSKYLEKAGGKDVFTEVMDYWRTSYSTTLDTAEALAKSVPASLYSQIDDTIDYAPLNLRFTNDTEEWMSKLCLNFYLSTLSNDQNIASFSTIDRNALLYDSIDSAQIEGGGRLVVALTDTSFQIPDGSDSGLIYVGLDENFQPITDFVYK